MVTPLRVATTSAWRVPALALSAGTSLFCLVVLGVCAPAVASQHRFSEETALVSFLHAPSEEPCAVVGVAGGEVQTRPYPIPGGPLTFTFANWPAADEDSLRLYLSWALPHLAQRMGPPAFPNLVTIRFDPQLGYLAVYDYTHNEIIIKWLPSVHPAEVLAALIHELSHAWRDDLIIWAQSFEEGLARGIEVRLMDFMPASYQDSYGNTGHRYFIDVTEQTQNQLSIACPFGNFVLPTLTARRYALAGWVFWKLEEAAHRTFLDRFHGTYFARCQDDPTFPQNLAGIRQLMQQLVPEIDRTPAAVWWDLQYIMALAPQSGDEVFVPGEKIGVTCFWRDQYGGEYPYQGILVEWSLTDRDDQPLASGSLFTNANGNAFPAVSLPGYYGKGTATYQVHLPSGTVEKTQVYWLTPSMPIPLIGYGLFGVVSGPDGPIEISSLDGSFRTTIAVARGEFRCEELDGVAGAFRLFWNGRECVVRKDIASYFVFVSEETTTPVSVPETASILPFTRSQIFPNPFIASLTIPFTLERAGSVRVAVYAVSGRLVRTLRDEFLTEGHTAIVWDGKDDHGSEAPSGVYYIQLQGGGNAIVRKANLLR